MHSVFGYGTFITKQMYKGKQNVRAAYLPNYYRVYRPQDWFPYILMDDNSFRNVKSGFWGLLFYVTENELRHLDQYEGEGSIYRRIRVDGLEKTGEETEFFVYYPMNHRIEWRFMVEKNCK